MVRDYQILSALVAITQHYLAGQPPWTSPSLAMTCGMPLARLEEAIDILVHHGILLRTSEPEGIVLGRPPEHLTGATILEALRDSVDSMCGQPKADAIWNFLQCRAQVARQALADVTLTALAMHQGGDKT
jgi:DNA-binding IscR family transcriptional regulator